MTHEHECAAYNGLAPPRDLPTDEVVPYLLLRIVYRHFRDGILPQTTAAEFKACLMEWLDCPVMERAALLRYGFMNEFERARGGAADAWKIAQQLAEAHFALPLDTWNDYERGETNVRP